MNYEITVDAFADMHVHFRELEQCQEFAKIHAQWCDQVLAMPNTREPLADMVGWMRYQNALERVEKSEHMTSHVALYLTESHHAKDIQDYYGCGVRIAKVYPRHGTTNSDQGVRDYRMLWPALAKMEELDMVLCLHGEQPGACCLDAEKEFLGEQLGPILKSFPKLRVVLEHITTEDAVNFVTDQWSDTLRATITAHHLSLTIDDVIGAKLQPLNFCKPVAKRIDDREALIRAAVNERYFFLGSDSAPHSIFAKYQDGCAGCFTAPVLPHLLAEVFSHVGKGGSLHRLDSFVSEAARDFYRLPPATFKLRITKVGPHRSDWFVTPSVPGYPVFGPPYHCWQVQRIDMTVGTGRPPGHGATFTGGS